MTAPQHPRSISEGMFLPVHGQDQWITIRGADRSNPVLLILHGTGFALSTFAPFFAPWEQDWTLVQWDQPGAGSTYARNPGQGTAGLSFDRITRHAIAVTEFVLERLGVARLAVFATSGGTMIGLKLIKARPELFCAYVGNGQVVNYARQEPISYGLVLARARASGDAAAVAELEALGAPPYETVAAVAAKNKYANAMTPAEQAVFAALDPTILAALRTPPAGADYVAPGLAPFDARAVSRASFEALVDDFAAFDARAFGLHFDVPMFFFQGEQDLHTVTSEVQSYAAEIHAPQKMLVLIPEGGHMSFFLRDPLLALLNAHVRPLASGASR